MSERDDAEPLASAGSALRRRGGADGERDGETRGEGEAGAGPAVAEPAPTEMFDLPAPAALVLFVILLYMAVSSELFKSRCEC